MAKTKTAPLKARKTSFWQKIKPTTPGKKLLAFVLVFAILGGGYFAYRSFAAIDHIDTVLAEDKIFNNTTKFNKPKAYDMPAGKSTKKAAYVEKGEYFWLDSNRDLLSQARSYQACFSVYNTKPNKVRLMLYYTKQGSNALHLIKTTDKSISGSSSPQSHCVQGAVPAQQGTIELEAKYIPMSIDGVVYKVTYVGL